VHHDQERDGAEGCGGGDDGAAPAALQRARPSGALDGHLGRSAAAKEVE
jgi:hypothetical protein